MNAFHWIEAKQLDRVMDFSTEVEIIKAGIHNNIDIYYYCSFGKDKNSYNLGNHIIYLGNFKKRYLKGIEFRFLVFLKAMSIIFKERNSVIMVSNHLILFVLPALIINRILNKKNRFIVDIRTTPVEPSTFDRDMKILHFRFGIAVKYFDGFSFITPFMEKYLMTRYKKQYRSVNWSSGVDLDLFDPSKYKSNEKSKTFKIFYHGSIAEHRGNLDLIKACKILKEEGLNIELLQIGHVFDNSIARYIEENDLGEWFKLLPAMAIDHIPKYISQCDLPVLPFRNFIGWRVSSPLKLMEYLAMGKKVLAPKMECFTDVFGDYSNHIYYYSFNSGKEVLNIANAIRKIIRSNKTNANYHPELRKFVINHYTWERQANNLFDFSKSLWIH